MNFTLNTFQDVFTEKLKYGNYKLYVFILATIGDNKIFPEIISYFDEINSLTGRSILVLCPRIQGNRKDFNSNDVLYLFRTGILGQKFGFKADENISNMIIKFIHDQTKLTYEFLDFLGESPNNLPSIIFFNDLSDSSNYLKWSLKDYSIDRFIEEFRELITAIKQNTMWEEKIKLKELQDKYWFYGNKYASLRYSDLRKNKRERIELEEIVMFYDLPKKILDEYERILTTNNFHYCIENAKKIFDEFKLNGNNSSTIDKLIRYRRAWRSRIPKYLNGLLLNYTQLYLKIGDILNSELRYKNRLSFLIKKENEINNNIEIIKGKYEYYKSEYNKLGILLKDKKIKTAFDTIMEFNIQKFNQVKNSVPIDIKEFANYKLENTNLKQMNEYLQVQNVVQYIFNAENQNFNNSTFNEIK